MHNPYAQQRNPYAQHSPQGYGVGADNGNTDEGVLSEEFKEKINPAVVMAVFFAIGGAIVLGKFAS